MAVAASPTWTNQLSFTMQSQLQSEWCWAATSCSVSHFYDPASTFSQCSIVNSVLGQTNCCADGSTSQCNVPWYLDRALTETGNLASSVGNALSLPNLAAEIAAGRVVCVRVGWIGGAGHFLALAGVDVPNSRVLVEDPIYGTSDYAFADFSSAYQGAGTWTNSYLTHPAAGTALGGGGAPPRPTSPKVNAALAFAATRLVGLASKPPAPVMNQMNEEPTYQVYFATLTDAANGAALANAKLIGYRSSVFDESSKTSTSVEVNVQDDGTPRSPHMTQGPFVESARQQTREIDDLIRADGFVEVRYLKIPGINVRALWVRSKTSDDVVVPLAPVPPQLQAGRRYSDAAFEDAIKPIAIQRMKFDG